MIRAKSKDKEGTMSFQMLLHRKLSAEGCIQVGLDLALRLKIMKGQGTTLPAPIEAEIEKIIQLTKNVELVKTDVSMNTIDQATDRMIAGFFGLFSARELCYTFSEVLALEPEEKELFKLCNQTKKTIFPEGTKFVQESHEIQWKHLQKIEAQLVTPEVQASLTTLGMNKEAARLLRWIKAYGTRLGVAQTRSEREKQLSSAVDSFHSAWEDFTVEVRHTYKDHSAESNRMCLQLLSPYDRQIEKEEEILLQSSGLQANVKR
jgi:hypothetical protein